MFAQSFRRCGHLISIVVLLIALPALPATAAEGLNLAWDHCLGEGTGVQNVTFACATNVGSHTITGSFVLGRDLADIIGLEIVLDLAAASPSLPPWWTFLSVGSCRESSLSADLVADPSDVVCQDWALGQAAGGLAIYCTIAGECLDHPTSANLARIKVASAVAHVQSQNLLRDVEYFGFHVSIDHQKTVGTGSCGGCQTPVCIVLNSIDVVGKNNIGSRKLTTPSAPGSNFVAWQGGGVPVVGTAVGCPAATAVRHSAWSAVKALYR